MRTKKVVALITEYKNFSCHVVPILTILELMDISPPDFYLREYKCTYKSDSWKTFEALWSGLLS